MKLQGFDFDDIPNRLDMDLIMNETINIIKETGNQQHLALISKNLNVQNILGRNSLGENQNDEGNLSNSQGKLHCEIESNDCLEGDVLASNKSKVEDNSSTSSKQITSHMTRISRPTVPDAETNSDSERLSKNKNMLEIVKRSQQELCTNKLTNLETEQQFFGPLEKQNDYKFSQKSKDFQVVFIGTGASLPSKYRNVSATLLHIR